MRAYKQLVNGEYVVPNLKCYYYYIYSFLYLFKCMHIN